MRIVGGRLKGRSLKGPASDTIRPTSDRLRETIFNILRHSHDDPVAGVRVLDLFAGTGAMAIEALSRGAREARLIDTGIEAHALIRANLEALGLTASASLLRRDATKLGKAQLGECFGLAFLDPPYGKGLVPPALEALRKGAWLETDALLVIEEARDADIVLPEGFALIEARAYGDTRILLVRAA
jgi:16S rRNA (guanine966-N2)-methyltransferase